MEDFIASAITENKIRSFDANPDWFLGVVFHVAIPHRLWFESKIILDKVDFVNFTEWLCQRHWKWHQAGELLW